MEVASGAGENSDLWTTGIDAIGEVEEEELVVDGLNSVDVSDDVGDVSVFTLCDVEGGAPNTKGSELRIVVAGNWVGNLNAEDEVSATIAARRRG